MNSSVSQNASLALLVTLCGFPAGKAVGAWIRPLTSMLKKTVECTSIPTTIFTNRIHFVYHADPRHITKFHTNIYILPKSFEGQPHHSYNGVLKQRHLETNFPSYYAMRVISVGCHSYASVFRLWVSKSTLQLTRNLITLYSPVFTNLKYLRLVITNCCTVTPRGWWHVTSLESSLQKPWRSVTQCW